MTSNLLLIIKGIKLGLKVGVVTNNWIDDINPVLDHSLWGELSNYIDVMIQSCRVGIRKPDKDIYLLACRELDLKPKQVSTAIIVSFVS